MSGSQWTIENDRVTWTLPDGDAIAVMPWDGHLDWGHMAVPPEAAAALVDDITTLAAARELAHTVAAFADPVKPGTPLGALLDLLTEDEAER